MSKSIAQNEVWHPIEPQKKVFGGSLKRTVRLVEERALAMEGSRPAAFTMIELLVVICILSILAGLLMPGLKAARDKARALKCVSNLRQWGVAFHAYAGENNDRLPPCFYDWGAPSPKWPNYCWFMVVGKYFDAKCDGTFTAWRAVFSPSMVGVNSVVCCPSDKDAQNRWQTSYAYHAYFPAEDSGDSDLSCSNRNLADFRKPGSCFLLVDQNSQPPGGNENMRIWAGTPQGWATDRHNGGLNLLFADGHVEYRKGAALPDYVQDRDLWVPQP